MSEPIQSLAVCASERFFPDDVKGPCVRCGVDLYYRPSTAALRVPTMCFPCYLTVAQPGDTYAVTGDTLREIALLDAKTGREQ